MSLTVGTSYNFRCKPFSLSYCWKVWDNSSISTKKLSIPLFERLKCDLGNFWIVINFLTTLTERPECDGGGRNGRRIWSLWRNRRQSRGEFFRRRWTTADGHSRPAFGLRPAKRLLATLFSTRFWRHPRAGHAGRFLSWFRFGHRQSPQTLLH